MDKAQLISEVKELLGNAETEKALGRLVEFLQSDPKYRELHSVALQARAQFQKAQRDEIQGLASSEQTKLSYNQATRQLLQVLEWLEEGNLKPNAGLTPGPPPSRWPWIGGAIALALVLLGGGYWWLKHSPPPQGEGQATACKINKEFRETSRFNILLVPFQAVTGDASQRPHLIIARQLESFIKGLNIDCDFGTYEDVDPDDFFSTEDADTAAVRCGAHLIIWGTVEKPSPSDSFIVNTQYKFVKQDSFIRVSKLELQEGSELAKVEALSILPTGTTLTQSILESIKLLFGLIAYETGDQDKAIEMLEAYEPAPDDTTAHLLKGMLLGEEYLSKGQEEQAWEAYNQLLETHDYPLARNNRGLLNYKKGNYEEAAEDLTVFLEKKPADTVALEARGTAYLKAEQLQKARQDLQEVRKLRAAPSTELKQKLEEVDKKIQDEEKAKASAEAELQANPNNLAAWNQKAISSVRLGDYRDAVSSGEAILRRDPDNLDAFVQIIKAYRSAGDSTQVEETIRRAEAAGITRRQLGEVLPFQLVPRPVTRFPIERKNK